MMVLLSRNSKTGKNYITILFSRIAQSSLGQSSLIRNFPLTPNFWILRFQVSWIYQLASWNCSLWKLCWRLWCWVDILSHCYTLSLSVLVESLNKDEFNDDAAGGVRTNHSSSWVSLAGRTSLSFLSVYFPCSRVPSENQTKPCPQHDIPSAVKLEKKGVAANSPCRVSLYSLSPTTAPTHKTKCLPPQISLPSSSLLPPSFTSVPLLPPSAPLLSLNSWSMLQDRDQSVRWFTGRPYCFTASLTAPPDPDSRRDASPGWLARSLRSCLPDHLIGWLIQH